MNQKDLRIMKLFAKGMTEAQIARKIGYGGAMERGVERVREAIQRHDPTTKKQNIIHSAQFGVEVLPSSAQLLDGGQE